MYEDTGNRQSWWIARLFTLIVVPAIGAYTLLEPFGRDQGIHATIAYALDNGFVTYRDVYNVKPPLTTAVHWLSQTLFGHSMMSIRILDLIFATLTALGLVEIGRLLHRNSIFGYAVSVGFALLYYSYGFWEHSQTDGWAGFLVVPALLLFLLGWDRPKSSSRFSLMFGAGAILGIAFCLKYTIGGAGILVFAPLIANLFGRTGVKFLPSDFLACFMGGATALGVVVSTMALFGALNGFIEIQSFVANYVAITTEDGLGLLHGFLLPGMFSQYLLGIVIAGLFVAVVDWITTKKPILVVITVLWILAGWLSGHVQGKGFAYHFLPLVPVYATLIGFGVEGITRRVAKGWPSHAIAIAMMVGLYLPSMAASLNKLGLEAVARHDLGRVYIAPPDPTSDFDIVGVVKFADVLKAHREPDDDLFVWGYSTMLYFLVENPPRYRYLYSWPFLVDYYDGRYTQDLLDRLGANPPKHFVVQSQDATPWATGNNKSSNEALSELPSLEQFLELNYHRIETHSRFSLYERNDSQISE